ncbi:hypothetical protein YC2023_069590 [Brassica napus]
MKSRCKLDKHCAQLKILQVRCTKSLTSCYHAVIIVAVKKHDGEWVAVCKLSNGTHIGDHGYLYVSLMVQYMLWRKFMKNNI